MWTSDYDKLMAQADTLRDGSTKISLIEQAVKLAETHQDEKREFEAKLELMTAVTFGGEPEKMLVLFPWLIAKCDENKEEYSTSRVLWTYKWVMESLPDYSELSKAQINSAMDDMETRFRKENYKERTIFEFRRILAMKFGDMEEAKKWEEAYANAPAATLVDRWLGVANCEACELNNELDYFLFAKEEDKALSAAAPILSGQMSCGEVPHNTYPKLLLPLMKRDRLTEAANYFQRGVSLIRGNKKLLKEHSEMITFAALTGNFPKAIKMLEENLESTLESKDADGRFRMFLAARLLFECLKNKKLNRIRMNMPGNFPLNSDAVDYSVDELREWFWEEARKIAQNFDRRNGNTHYSKMLENNLRLSEYATDFKVN